MSTEVIYHTRPLQLALAMTGVYLLVQQIRGIPVTLFRHLPVQCAVPLHIRYQKILSLKLLHNNVKSIHVSKNCTGLNLKEYIHKGYL